MFLVSETLSVSLGGMGGANVDHLATRVLEMPATNFR